MAFSKFRCEVLTPDGEVFDDEVEMVSTRTADGLIGVRARHSPLLGVLDPTELRLYRSETDIVRFAQAEGYIQVADNHAMLLVEDAIAPESLNIAELREHLVEADNDLAAAGEDTEKRRLATQDKRRWEAFLRIAEGS